MLYVFVWLIFLLFQTNGDPVFECEPDWIHSQLDNTICYSIVTSVSTFDEAESTCQSKGGHLATVFNQFTNTYISLQILSQLQTDHFWIGAKRNLNTSAGKIWSWTDDNKLLTFNDFNPSSPSTGDCAGVQRSTLWEAIDCQTKNQFICEIPAKVNVCDDGWVYYKESHQCYRLFGKTNETNYFYQNISENICIQNGGHLASIHNETENTFIGEMSMIYNGGSYANIWIGLMQNYNGSYWTDGSLVDYHNFQNTNPQSGNCIIFTPKTSIAGNTTGFWYWTSCSYNTYRFICKKPPQKSVNNRHQYCDDGLIPSNDISICYDFKSNKTTFDDAQNICYSEGGFLAPILDQNTNLFISYQSLKIPNFSPFWIGGDKFNTTTGNTTVSIWVWDEIQWKLWMNYTDWDPSTILSQSCAISEINTLWSTTNCNDNHSFVCQIPAKIDICDDGWTYYEEKRACYGVFSSNAYLNQINQKSAENFCITKNAHLASIHDEKENRFIASISAFESYPNLWIGLMQNTNASDWYWTDGSPVSYHNLIGQDNGTCVLFNSGPWNTSVIGAWFTENCSDTVDRFICKKAPYRTIP